MMADQGEDRCLRSAQILLERARFQMGAPSTRRDRGTGLPAGPRQPVDRLTAAQARRPGWQSLAERYVRELEETPWFEWTKD